MTFQNGKISNFQGLVTLILDQFIYIVVHHSSTSTHMPNFIEIKETFLWTDEWTFETGFITPTMKSRPKNSKINATIHMLYCHHMGMDQFATIHPNYSNTDYN